MTTMICTSIIASSRGCISSTSSNFVVRKVPKRSLYNIHTKTTTTTTSTSGTKTTDAPASTTAPYQSPILSVLTSPLKLAERLDRQAFRFHDRCVTSPPKLLCLDIQRHQLNIAIAGHPRRYNCTNDDNNTNNRYNNTNGRDAVVLPPIPTVGRKISATTVSQLWDVIQQHKVHGFLVHWPIQHDTMRLGAHCGRTLYTLEKLQLESMIDPNDRPVCLFPISSSPSPTTTTRAGSATSAVDKWGRCANYGRTRPVIEDLRLVNLSSSSLTSSTSFDFEEVHEEDVDEGTQRPMYYYHALRDRYYGCRNNDKFSSLSMSSSSADTVLKLWDQFCNLSWPDSATAAASQHYQQPQHSRTANDTYHTSTVVMNGYTTSAATSSNWTRPSRSRRKSRTRYIEYDDDIDEADSDDESRIPSSSSTSSSPRHLFVDRALRQAATATAETETAAAAA